MTRFINEGRWITIAIGALSIVTILALVISLISQADASDAKTRTAKVAADEAANRAAQAKALAASNEAQAQRIRDSVCSLLVDVGQAKNLQAATPLGRKLVFDAQHSAVIAGCGR